MDLRLGAATNRDLGQAVTTGTFRADLYYHLHVITALRPSRCQSHPSPTTRGKGASPHPVRGTLEQARAACERTYVVQVLTATQGTVSRAAVLAGMHRVPFYKLLQKYAIDSEAFRKGTGPM